MLPTRRIQPVAVSGWTYLTRPHVGCHLHGLHSSMIRTAAAADRTVPAATVVSERPAFRTITATPVEKVVRNNRTLDPREAEVTPSTLIRKTIADNGNEYTTPNSIYREVKKLGDVFRSKRHFKRVLGPMRRSNQFAITKVKDEKGHTKYAYRLKNTRYVKDLLAKDQLRLHNVGHQTMEAR